MPDAANAANTQQIAHWNSPQMRNWSERHGVIDAFFREVTARLMAFAAPAPGEAVIDIGCGSGTTLLAAAEAVGPEGRVLGIDVAEASIATARQRISTAGLTQAEAVVADATDYPFPAAAFDLALSRYGVMFFADPAASFANIRKGLKPGGRLRLAVFRTGEENPWATGALATIADLVPPAPPAGPEAPGQFSWASPERVRRILTHAGFHEIELTPFDLKLHLAPPGKPEEAMAHSRVLGGVARALAAADEATRAAMEERLRHWFAAQEGPQGIALPAALWLVGARA